MSIANSIIAHCPVCSSSNIAFLFKTKDYSLTGDCFDLIQCNNCQLLFSHPFVEPEKIAPYYQFPEYISHSDIKKGWMNSLYHQVRHQTLQIKTKWIQSLFTGHKGSLLEVGAGTGAFANAMSNKGWKVTALEPDEASRQKAFDQYGLSLLPIEELTILPTRCFDVITLWHVLEHVHALKLYMNTFKKLLKPNGRLIIAVPNHTSFDAQFYQKYWAAYDVPRHLYHFSPKSMSFLMQSFGMSIVQMKPMWFDSFYVSLLSEKYKKTGVLGIFRAFIIGCLSNIYAIKNNRKASSIIYVVKLMEQG